ncbi:MAG: Fmu (Sun) domain-containing protein [Chitinophagales bacterium]
MSFISCNVSRYHSYINSAVEIISAYDGEEPCLPGRQAFASFIKKYFSLHKKFGSKDRKNVSHLCYCYFRLGKALPGMLIEERIIAGLFLCSKETNETLQQLKPEWNEKVKLPLDEKLSSVRYGFSTENIFPWKDELSNGIEYKKFCESFLTQPDLFLRLRPGNEMKVKERLLHAHIQFKEISSSCLSLPNTSKLEEILELDKEAVIQDYSSQRTGEFLQFLNLEPEISVWDCCAGSGGKSIMIYDLNPKIDLTVSDNRKSILINLKKRFEEAGIKKYKSFVLDLSEKNNQQSIINNQQSMIIADVPCTGSGTWSRTPEQLYYFTTEKILEYSSLQKGIVSNVIPHVLPGGFLLYITCSVFKKENEEVIDLMKNEFHFELIRMELLKGYDKKADTMFVALLQKPL